MTLERLWNDWRSEYLSNLKDDVAGTKPGRDLADQRAAADVPQQAGDASDGVTRSIFDDLRNSGEPDSATFIVARSELSFVVLNLFPYTSAAALVLPKRVVADLELLSDDEHDDLWRLVRRTVNVQKIALRADAMNVGINLGRAAGGSQPSHLHVHCVPRHVGDTNFMMALADTRAMPMSLPLAWQTLRTTWTALYPDDIS